MEGKPCNSPDPSTPANAVPGLVRPAAMEGEPCDSPDGQLEGGPSGGMLPQWRGSLATPRTCGTAPGAVMPGGQYPPQWRGSLATPRTPDANADASARRSWPQWRGSLATPRTGMPMEGEPCDSPAVASRNEPRGAAMEGEPCDSPDLMTSAQLPKFGEPCVPGHRRSWCRRRPPQWRGSLATPRTLAGLTQDSTGGGCRNGGGALRLPGPGPCRSSGCRPLGRRNGGGALRLPGLLALDGGLDLGFHPGLRAVMVGGFAFKHIRLSKSQECVVPERIEHWPGSPVSPDRSHQMIMGPEVGSRLATPMNLKHSLPRWFGAPRSTIAIESREWWIISPRSVCIASNSIASRSQMNTLYCMLHPYPFMVL